MAQILFISHRIPYPPDKGEKIRALQFIENLKKSGHTVCCAFPMRETIDFSYAQQLKNYVDKIIHPEDIVSHYLTYMGGVRSLLCDQSLTKGFHFSQPLYDLLKQDTMHYDIVIFYSAVSWYYKSAIKFKKSICDFVDMDSYKWGEYAETAQFPMTWIYKREQKLLSSVEKHIAEDVDLSLFVTKNEMDLFKQENSQLADAHEIDYIECRVNTSRFNPAFQFNNPFNILHRDQINLVMTGAMDYRPNYMGALYFIKEILPKLRQKTDKKIGFYCVGRNPVNSLKRYHDVKNNVVITGEVDDVRPYIAHSFACVAPLFVGRGIQNKVLEGMAMGKTCFVSGNAFEGIDAIDGKHLIVCRDGDSWVEKISEAVNSPISLHQLGSQAAIHVSMRYSNQHILKKTQLLIDRLSKNVEKET